MGNAEPVQPSTDVGPAGTRLLAGRYELAERLAAGGTARVYAAVDRVLDRRVAVKLLDADAVESGRPGGRERFTREARATARFTHPDAVTVYDAGEDGDQLYLVLELVEGPSLAQVLADGPLAVDEAVRVARHVLAALGAAHAAGLVHRDVKPANVLLGPRGEVKLADFGIARRFDELEEDLTAAGTVVGTPRYLAPEQRAGEAVTPATDVHAVGLLLREMLTGWPDGDGPSPSHVPPALDHVVARALASDPAARWPSATAMAVALDRSLSGAEPTAVAPAVGAARSARGAGAAPPPTTRAPATIVAGTPRRQGRWIAVAIALVLVLAAIAGVALGRDDDPSLDAVAASAPAATTAPASATVPATTPTTAPAVVTTAPAPATTAPPVTVAEIIPGFPVTEDLGTFLDQLRADPAVAGPAGGELADELARVLDRNGRKRRDAADELVERLDAWVDDGALDPTLSAALVQLLAADAAASGGGDDDD